MPDASQANASVQEAKEKAAAEAAAAEEDAVGAAKLVLGPYGSVASVGQAGGEGSWASNISLRYPKDIVSNESDFIYFEFFNYSPPFQTDVSGGLLSVYNKSLNDSKPATDLPKVMLYMPEGVTTSYKADWAGKKFSNIAAGILSSGTKIGKGKINDALGNATKTALGGIGRLKDEAAFTAINKLISSVTGDTLTRNDVFSSTGGVILNPNAELIFGGHDLRTFKVKFLMVPYSETEAMQVDQITRVFKKAMLPRYQTSSQGFFNNENGGETNDPANSEGKHGWIGLPNLCKFTFMKGSGVHPYLSQYKMCAITDVDISYTPDGVYASTYKGYPVATQLEVGFLETKLVYAEEIKATGASF